MKKICFALAASAMVFSGAAMAQTVEKAFASKGECQRWLNWDSWYAKAGIPNPLGGYPANAKCERIDGKWYIITG